MSDLANRIVELRAQGKTYPQIAAELGITRDRVKNIYHRAKEQALLPSVEMPAEPSADEIRTALEQHQQEERGAYERRLLKELLSERSQTEQIIEAISDLITRVPCAQVKRLPAPETDSSAQTAFLMLSDLHVGAVATPEETGGFGEYNYPVFRRRLFRLRDVMRSITAHHRKSHPVDRLVVGMLGDNVEGDEIFPSQSRQIDLDIVEQVIRAVDDLAEFYVSLLDTYETISVASVIGNHGRIGRKGERKKWVNWDYLLAHMLRAKLERFADRIQFEIPKTPFIAVEIEGWTFLLRHGDGVKSWAGIPFYGLQRSVGRLTAIQAAVGSRFDYLIQGHLHTPASLPWTGGETLINGSFVGTNEFSVDAMESLNRPVQLFGLVHNRYGLAARYPVWLEDGGPRHRLVA